jgi:hypothetical protein
LSHFGEFILAFVDIFVCEERNSILLRACLRIWCDSSTEKSTPPLTQLLVTGSTSWGHFAAVFTAVTVTEISNFLDGYILTCSLGIDLTQKSFD